jgi:TolB-like protein
MRFLKFSRLLLMASLFCGQNYASAQYKEIDGLASTIAGPLSRTPDNAVAVVDFTDLQGNVTELGRFLAEELSISLSGPSRGLHVIDRTHLKAVLQEHKLAASGIIEPATWPRLGEITGAHVLITGTITPFGDSVRCAVKAINAATARIEGVATTEIPRTKTIEELLSNGISASTPSSSGQAPGFVKGVISANRPQPESSRLPTDFDQASSSNTPPRRPLKVVEADGFSFSLMSCKRSGDGLFCNFQITNRRNDRRFVINANYAGNRSRIIDGSGREFLAGEVHIGANSFGGHADTRLAAGVPVASTIAFSRVPPDLSSIALLEVNCYAEGIAEANGYFRVQLRNISVTGDE